MFYRLLFTGLCSIYVFFVWVGDAKAASLSLHPSSGTFTVGGTLDVSLFLDTQGEYINAVEVFLDFPADKLQLVSPTTGSSIIDIWTTLPRFNNQNGTIELRGGIPRGINVSDGLVTTLKFRVKSTGSAVVRFSQNSRVYLNDGKGTDALSQTQSGVYQLALPPPAGPIVASETHEDQSRWYSNSTVVLNWAFDPGVEGYSYVLNADPIATPDDTSEGVRSSVAYRNVADGQHYFHIKALRDGRWGGLTHFAVQVDASPPAEFPVEIVPSAKTIQRRPSIQFETTDAHSGLDHFELKIVPLQQLERDRAKQGEDAKEPFFIEAQSPYITPRLELGSYDVIVRAYDKASNFIDIAKRFHIVNPLFQFVADKGLEIKHVIVIPWPVIWGNLIFLILVLLYIGWRLRGWHKNLDEQRTRKQLHPSAQEQLEELKKYQQRYGKMLLLILMMGSVFFAPYDAAGQEVQLEPPFVSAVSRNISNEEIFYVGGKTEAGNIEVVIYLQNLRTGETLSSTVSSDRRGDWFYRHNAFLSAGDYLLWTQSKLGEQASPPSPQIRLQVQPTAIQFGASRVSYEILYLAVSIVLFLALAGVGSYVLIHALRARRKHREFMKELKEAEESIKRGFAVLRRDIAAELAVIKKARLTKELSQEEKLKEAQLLQDLEMVEKRIGKEVWDVEKAEHVD